MGLSLPGMVAHPPSLLTVSRLYAGAALRAASLVAASAPALNWNTQMSERAEMTALSAPLSAAAAAVPEVVQPPQLNTTIERTIAPPNAPHNAGFSCCGTLIR